MEQINRVIVSLVYYNSLIRDSLEYTIARDNFDVNFYNYKKYGIINELKLNTPLKGFLDSNGDKGNELRKKLETFGEELYGDKSTLLRADEKTVKVDRGQVNKIFEMAIPLHEEMNSVIKLHSTYSTEHGTADEKITQLLVADENFYRAVAMFTVSSSIFEKFQEFNKAMNESQGQKTPQASFIEQELQVLLRCYEIVAQNATTKDELFVEAKDAISQSIEMMTNRRDLPKGKNFGDVFNDCRAKANKFLLISEEEWKKTYEPAVNEMKADLDALRAKAEENKAQ